MDADEIARITEESKRFIDIVQRISSMIGVKGNPKDENASPYEVMRLLRSIRSSWHSKTVIYGLHFTPFAFIMHDDGKFINREDAEYIFTLLRAVHDFFSDDFLKLYNDAIYILSPYYDLIQEKEEQGKQLEPGFVYIIKSAYGHKIGRTKSIKDRSKQFEVKLPFEWEMTHILKCTDMYVAEKFLHGWHQSERINGEWFNLNDTALAIYDMAARVGIFE